MNRIHLSESFSKTLYINLLIDLLADQIACLMWQVPFKVNLSDIWNESFRVVPTRAILVSVNACTKQPPKVLNGGSYSCITWYLRRLNIQELEKPWWLPLYLAPSFAHCSVRDSWIFNNLSEEESWNIYIHWYIIYYNIYTGSSVILGGNGL